MKIAKLKKEHLIEAGRLVFENYKEECAKVSALPKIERIPNLECLAENPYGW